MLDKMKLRLMLWSRSRYILAARRIMGKLGLKYVRMLVYERPLDVEISQVEARVLVEIKLVSTDDMSDGKYRGVRLAAGDDPMWHNVALQRLNNGEVCLVAMVEGGIAGYAWIYFKDTKYEPAIEREESFAKDEALIYDVAVPPNFRRNKISEKLIERGLSLGKLKGYIKAYAYVEADNVFSMKSFEAVGFYATKIITCFKVFKFKRIREHPVNRSLLSDRQVKTANENRLVVEPLQNEEEWERFVAGSHQGTFYHTLPWRRTLEKSFPLEAIYLVIRDCNRELVAVCPFVIRKELKVIKLLDSLWHSDYGGPLVREGYAELAMSALAEYLRQLAHEKGIAYARIRFTGRDLCQYLCVGTSKIDTSIGTMMLDLEEKPTDFIWNKVFTKKDAQRKYIRRFEQAGYQVREAEVQSDDLSKFYALYYNNLTYVGGLPFRFEFFENISSLLSQREFNILLAEKNGKSIGALGFYACECTNTIYLAYLGLVRSLDNTFHTSHYLYWSALQWAEKFGYRYVSFGSTRFNPSEVHHKLKSKFGAEFNQDYIVYLPFNRGVFFVRLGIAKLWELMGTRLPKCVAHRLLTITGGQPT